MALRINRAIELSLTLTDQSEDRYVRVPFEVPPGTDTLEVRLKELDGDGVVDLGCDGADGWRGWSGGARRTFTLTATDATPGYLPGAPEAGEWAVVLGLHALPTGDTRLRVHITSPATTPPDHGPHPEPVGRRLRGSDRDLPAPAGNRWFAGDTHAHSLHSDGALSLSELANEAVRSGLDFLCATDHNTISHHAHLRGLGAAHGITLVPGQEVTTHRGHANAFGDIGFIDFREDVDHWARTVAERGGLLSVNHPVSGDCSWLHEVPPGAAGVEILHSDLYQQPISMAALAWLELARGGDDPPAAGASVGAEVDDVVGGLDDIEVVLDDEHSAGRRGR